MPEPTGNLLHPRHWHSWLGIGLLRLVSLLPWGLQRLLARALGALCFHLIPVRRHVTLVNLRLCFPGLTEAERRTLARRHYQSLALGILEVARSWWRAPAELPPHRIIGLEHLEAAKARGKGVLLVSGHFTTLEITGRMLSLATRLSCLYRDPNNAVLAESLRRHRGAWASQAIPMTDLKGLLSALRAGEAVWYAPDQGRRSAQSQLLPFFGEPCITNTATHRLAQMSGAAVVQFYGRRLPDNSYELRILPALEGFPSDDAARDTLRLVAGLEEAVRAAPEQYLWVHRRFKRRRGLPDAYA